MKYGLVIDLGATNIRVSLVNSNHEIVKKIKTDSSKEIDIAFKIYSEYKKMGINCIIEEIIVGVPGTIDFKNNIIRDLPNLNIKEYDLKSALYKLFNVKVTIINDASLAALGEYSLNKEEKVFQYITVSSGIGGGLVYNGKLFEGVNGFEQEIGRIIIKGDMTFESLCSGNALKNRLLKENIDEEYASSALLSKKENYKKVVDEWLDDLSIGVSNIIQVVNPSMIVFGGGLGSYLDHYKNGLLERLCKFLPRDVIDDIKFKESYYKDDSGIIGGSYLDLNCFDLKIL